MLLARVRLGVPNEHMGCLQRPNADIEYSI